MVGQQAPCSVDVKDYSVSSIDGHSIEVAYKQSHRQMPAKFPIWLIKTPSTEINVNVLETPMTKNRVLMV